jgi:LDH2 family malate/lactate/ureidoglycolate dehydrogenase
VSSRRYPAPVVRQQIEVVLRAWGMPERHVAVTAGAMVEADLMGIDSHGISMLILYEQMQKAGQLKLAAEPKVVRESATTALIDGGAGLGHPVAAFAMQVAMEKALAHDIGVASVFNSHHFGACGTYAQIATRRQLIGIVSTTSRIVTVVPTRAAERRLGTNPLCFAFPTASGPPVMLDMSTSVVSANKVKMHALRGADIPTGWVSDGRGVAVTDADVAYRLLFEGMAGGLSPVGGLAEEGGGHKGYGLGVVAQILSSTLSGGSFSPIRNSRSKPSDPDNIGHFFMALNPAAFRPLEEFQADLAELVAALRATRPIRASEPVLVPGDPEWEASEERQREGIPLPAALADRIQKIAAAAGAPFLLAP